MPFARRSETTRKKSKFIQRFERYERERILKIGMHIRKHFNMQLTSPISSCLRWNSYAVAAINIRLQEVSVFRRNLYKIQEHLSDHFLHIGWEKEDTATGVG